MRTNTFLTARSVLVGLLGIAVAAGLAGCNGGAAQSEPTTEDPAAAIDAGRDAELDAREQELEKREAELAAKEQERENARRAAAKAAAAKRTATASAPPARNRPVRTAVAVPIDVPAGTQLTVALSSELSTKTAQLGDEFEARLVSDLMVDDRRVAPAGSRLTGTVSNVVSGSNAIGAVPVLGLKFDRLELADGHQVPISSEFMQQGKSEKARDTAKILGGAAAGAIIGHQVKNNDTGKIVGGLLGGAAGAVAAKKTGTEVQLEAGSQLTITLDRAAQVSRS